MADKKLADTIKDKIVHIVATAMFFGLIAMMGSYYLSKSNEKAIAIQRQEHEVEMVEVQNDISVLHVRLTKIADELKNFQINHISTHNDKPLFRGNP